MKKLSLLLLISISIIALISCKAEVKTQSKTDDINKTEVKDNKKRDIFFVSILPQKNFVDYITAPDHDVRVMVAPGASPATYEPSTKQIVKLSKAKAFFTIGVPFEDSFIPKVKQQLPNLEFVATDKGIQKVHPATFEEIFKHDDVHVEHNNLESHAHEHGLTDPHIWLSPELVKQQVQTISDYFVANYPAEQEDITSLTKKFIGELAMLQADITASLADASSRDFLCFHPSWGYFSREFNLNQIPIEIEGKEPSPREQKFVIEYAIKHGIKVIFVQKQFNQDIAASIAEQISGKVVAIDPLAEDYLKNMRAIADTLSKYLK